MTEFQALCEALIESEVRRKQAEAQLLSARQVIEDLTKKLAEAAKPAEEKKEEK